ncbi:hypothetical protein C8R44DRAFT_891408 [Mycena epipterygia]|nr:hypothetical protein C8R44DRAFT_891408 [Mycena epipterygia]
MTTQPLEISPGLKAFNLDVPTPRDYSEESRETMSDLSNSEPEVEDSTDREEGEIFEEEKVQSLNKSTKVHYCQILSISWPNPNFCCATEIVTEGWQISATTSERTKLRNWQRLSSS